MRITNPVASWRQRPLLRDLAHQVEGVEAFLRSVEAAPGSRNGPVVFFNASTRIHRLSLNAAFSLLASWAVRAGGSRVRYLVCQEGLQPCVLGTDRRSPARRPPCGVCLGLSRTLYPPADVVPLVLHRPRAGELRASLAGMPLATQSAWEFAGRPLGELTLPSVRWILRRHRLEDTPPVRQLFAGYLASAAGLAETVDAALRSARASAVVVFNGIFYPEAVVRRVAQDLAIPVITHEVGFRPFSAFFSHREATFREVLPPHGYELAPEQDEALDDVLSRRLRGDFSMAGVRFWPRMEPLPDDLLLKRGGFRQLVSVFPNVVFDTSQIHANTLFEDMFVWLDRLADVMRRETDTLFVVRAHPDEIRPGKESRETVAEWMARSGVAGLENVISIEPDRRISSYELIQASKFVLVYNSSVGLEASILGKATLCAGRSRFSLSEATHLPATVAAYQETLARFLAADEVHASPEQTRRARAFLYYELFHASLDLSEFLQADPELPGMVVFSDFSPARLREAEVFDVLRRGIMEDEPFLTRLPQAEPAEIGPNPQRRTDR